LKLICKTEKYLKIFPYFHQKALKYFQKISIYFVEGAQEASYRGLYLQ